MSCGSLWFIDAGSVTFIEKPISRRYLSQDDRIEIADGLAAGEAVKAIAARIGKSYQSIYREIGRNRKPDGHYQPWYAHNQAYLRRRRPKPPRFSVDEQLRALSPTAGLPEPAKYTLSRLKVFPFGPLGQAQLGRVLWRGG